MATLKNPFRSTPHAKLIADAGPPPQLEAPQAQQQQPPRGGVLGAMFGGGGDDSGGGGWGGGFDDDPRSRINKLGALMMMLDPMSANAGTSMLQLEQNRAATNYAAKRQNHTANWLMTQGLGEQEASFVASDPDALKEWYKQRTEMKTPKWEMHEIYNDKGQKVQAMIDMHTGKFSTVGGAAAPNLTIESDFDTNGRERKVLFNHDDGSTIPLAGSGSKTDALSPERQAQEIEQRQATKPSVVMQGENEERKTVYGEKGYGGAFNNYRANNDKAADTLSKLDLMDNMVRSPDFDSGITSRFGLQVDKLGQAFGFDTSNSKIVKKELFNAMSRQAVRDQFSTLGSGVSEGDRQLVEQTVANLDTSRGGNLAVNELHRILARRQQDIWKLALKYRKDNGRLDEGFDEQLMDWQQANPLMNTATLERIDKIAHSDPSGTAIPSPGVGDGSSGGDASAPKDRAYNPKTGKLE